MSEATIYSIADFQDLPFDVAKHEEALKSCATLDLDAQSVRATLCARDFVMFRAPSARFSVVVNPQRQIDDETASSGSKTVVEVLHSSTDLDEAEHIRTEVERYFARHFPGRTVSRTDSVPVPESSAYSVCIETERLGAAN